MNGAAAAAAAAASAEAATDADTETNDDPGRRLYLDDLVIRLDADRRFADIGIVEVEDYDDVPSDEARLNPAVDWLCSGTSGELDLTQVVTATDGINGAIQNSSNGSSALSIVSVIDRAFSAGDLVRWVNDEAGQAGTIEAVRRQCHLYLPGYCKLIVNVPADRILCGNFIDELGRQSVQYDGWYGTMQSIAREHVRLKFVDGSVIRMSAHLLEGGGTHVIGDFPGGESHPFSSERLYQGAFVELYPGLLRGHRSEVQWLRLGSNPGALRRVSSGRRLVAQVLSIDPASFDVDWHFCFPCLTARPLGDLPSELEADRLLACNPAIGPEKPALLERLTLGSFAYVVLRQDDKAFQVEPATSLGCALYELLLNNNGKLAELACDILPAVDPANGRGSGDAPEGAASSASCLPDAAVAEGGEDSKIDGLEQSDAPDVDGSAAVPRARVSLNRRRRTFGKLGRDRRAIDSRGLGSGGNSKIGGSASEGAAVLRELQRRTLQTGQMLAARIVCCSTRVDVRWQDGRLQTDIAACELVPFDDFMENQYFPGDFVLSSQQQQEFETSASDADCSDLPASVPDRYALVLENDVRQKLARVQWFRETASAAAAFAVSAEPLGPPELVSTIDLKEYLIYEYRPKSIVMLKSQQQLLQPDAANAMELCENKTPPAPIRLGDVVRVVLETGKIRVAWFDGEEADLWPGELFSLEGLLGGGGDQRSTTSDSSDFFNNNFDDNSNDDDDESWETESEETVEPDDCQPAAEPDWPVQGAVVQVNSGGDVVAMATPDKDIDMDASAAAPAVADSECWLPHHANCADEWACARQVGAQLRDPLRLIADCLREAVTANACRTVTSTVVHSVHQALDTVLLTAHGLRTQLHDLRTRPSCLRRCATNSQRSALQQFSNQLRRLTSDAACLEAFTDPEGMAEKLAPLRHALMMRRPTDANAEDQRVVPTFVPRIACPLHESLGQLWLSANCLATAGPEAPAAEPDETGGRLAVPEFNAMQEMMQLLYGQIRLRMGAQLSEATRKNLDFFRTTICRVMQVDIAEVVLPDAGGADSADRPQEAHQVPPSASALAPEQQLAAKTASEPTAGSGTFLLVECAPPSHLFYTESAFSGSAPPPKAFASAWRRELALLGDHLPTGVTVKAYEDRMDLMAVLIDGPAGTPYSGALFLFDLHLPGAYPAQPPRLLYRSMCSGRLNPNLYECGKVCVSLLGTWDGQGTERWAPGESNLLQVLVSVQGLILVEEPLFNEPGYEKGSQAAAVKSREYNELAVVRTAQSMANLVSSPPETFSAEVGRYADTRLRAYVDQLADWLDDRGRPGFPLLPLSAGAKLSLAAAVKRLTGIADKLERRR